jgi:YidC/Oxa1 family membrane protein insertase
MQKNMLLAIALSMLIMIVWMHFFAPEPPEQKEPTERTALQEQERPGEPVHERFDETAAPEAGPAVSEKPPSTEELAKARDIVVETAHLSATFSTLGGRLTSLRLPEYDSKRGGQMELVPRSEGMKWPLALEFHDTDFGERTENFVYETSLYAPPAAVLERLASGLRECSGKIYSNADEHEIRRQLDFCLPKTTGDDDLRALVLALASRKPFSGEAGDQLLRQADDLAQSQHLVFSRQVTPQLRLIKAFVFPVDSYSFDMHTVVQNTASASLDLGNGRSSYTVNWSPGLESSETSSKYDQLMGVSLAGKSFEQKSLKKLREEKEFSEGLVWIGLKRKYFFLVLEPYTGLMTASMETLDVKQETVHIGLDMQPITLMPGDVAANSMRLCAGPMLKDVLESLGPGFEQIINFGFFDLFGKMLLAGLLWFNKYVQNYGIAIILLTIVVRVGMFPLNQKSYKSMREMQALQPLVSELREKHKKNPQEMNKRMMELYRTHKVNPMGGCLPIAFQMPIFIALFQALRNAVELRGAHFLWIDDLSEPDRLFNLTVPFNLPINLLPLLVIGAMVIQQKMTPMAAGGQSEAQQKMMQYMPIIFGFLFYSMPSGLTVYFLVSTVLGLVQQYFVQKAT